MSQNKSFRKSETANRRTKNCFRHAFNNKAALILTAVVLVVGMSLNGTSQQTLSTPKSTSEELPASCSLSETKAKDQIVIKCQGMNPEQGERVSAAFNILTVMNKLLEDKLDPELVTAKLDELTKSATRVPRVKTYFCDGMWKSGASNSGGILDTKTGGNDSEFLSMIALLEKKQYPETSDEMHGKHQIDARMANSQIVLRSGLRASQSQGRSTGNADGV